MKFETPKAEPLYDNDGRVNDREIARHMATVQDALQDQELSKEEIDDLVESAGHIQQYAKELAEEKDQFRSIAEKMFGSLSEEEKTAARNAIKRSENDPEGIYKILIESLDK